jgi:hypothetical protein
MKTIDLSGPDGNVFCLLGYAKSIQRQLKKAGTNSDEIDEVLSGYTEMKYDDIVAKLEASGFFVFESRIEDEACDICGFSDCDGTCDGD